MGMTPSPKLTGQRIISEKEAAPDQVRHLSPKQLARRWGMSTRCLDRWRAERKGPRFLVIGRRVLYRHADICEFERRRLRETLNESGAPADATVAIADA